MDIWPAVGSSILERNPQRPRIHAFIWSVYGNVVFITRTYFSAAVCRLCRPISNRKRRSREGSRPAEACPSMRSALSKARQHPQGPASPCCDRTIQERRSLRTPRRIRETPGRVARAREISVSLRVRRDRDLHGPCLKTGSCDITSLRVHHWTVSGL